MNGRILLEWRPQLATPEAWGDLHIDHLLALARLALFDDEESAFERIRTILSKRREEFADNPDFRKEWNTLARFAAFDKHDIPGRAIKAEQWTDLKRAERIAQEWADTVRPEPALKAEALGNVYAVLLYDVAGDHTFSVYVGSTSETVERRVAKHLARYKAGRGLVYWYGVRGGGADDYADEMILWRVFEKVNPIPKSQLVRFEWFLADALRREGVTVYGGGQESIEDRVTIIRDPYTLHSVIMGQDTSWRHYRVPLPDRGLRSNAASCGMYAHQEAALRATEHNSNNGIVCLPTGAGKTRIAVEHMASAFRRDGALHRFLWVSYPTVVLKQGMASLLEWRDQLPAELHFRWSREGAAGEPDLLDDAEVTFLLRDSFAKLLAPGEYSPIVTWLAGDPRRRVTVILDEVHVLLPQKVVAGLDAMLGSRRGQRVRDRIRLIGFSATPVPNNDDAIHAARRYFPSTAGNKRPDWGIHVFEFRDAPSMVKDRVTCPPNLYIDRMKALRIPHQLLVKVARDRQDAELLDDLEPNESSGRLRPSGNLPAEFEDHARKAMGHPAVSAWLARRMVDLQGVLGKTIVFAPSIDAANTLYLRLRELGANAFLVHSLLDQMTPHSGTDARMNVSTQIARFKAAGSLPCFMVNVGILTTGFDDPAIQTVVLARPVRSLNLFWQMVGRGLRGPRAGGTASCNVVDIVNLQELFALDKGYSPEAHQLARFGAEGWFNTTAQASEKFAHAQPAPLLNAPSKLAALLLDREGWPSFIQLRALLVSLDGETLPDRNSALHALRSAGIAPTAAVLQAPTTGDQSTFWTVRLLRLAEERGDTRFRDLAVGMTGSGTVEDQYKLYEKVEQLLSGETAAQNGDVEGQTPRTVHTGGGSEESRYQEFRQKRVELRRTPEIDRVFSMGGDELARAAAAGDELSSFERRYRRGDIPDCASDLDANNAGDQASEGLRAKGVTDAGKKSRRPATRGLVEAYIQADSKTGVILEVNCETDFTTLNESFRGLISGIATHIAARSTAYVRREDVPAEVVESERKFQLARVNAEGAPEAIAQRLVDDRMSDFYKGVCLLEQKYVKDESKTVDQVVNEVIANIGENIVVRRFVRYTMGEGKQ